MKDQIRTILQPYFKEFQTVRDEFDQFAFTQYVLETGTKIFQLYQDYGLEKFDKNEIGCGMNCIRKILLKTGTPDSARIKFDFILLFSQTVVCKDRFLFGTTEFYEHPRIKPIFRKK